MGQGRGIGRVMHRGETDQWKSQREVNMESNTQEVKEDRERNIERWQQKCRHRGGRRGKDTEKGGEGE